MKTAKLILLFVLIQFTACGQTTNNLSVDDFENAIAKTKDKIVLDVRTPDEFSKGHLKDAKQMDFYKEQFKDQLKTLDKNKSIFVYCAAGKRSSATADMLKELGFTKINNLTGGFNAWKAANKPVLK